MTCINIKNHKYAYFSILSIFLIIAVQSINCNSYCIFDKKTIFVDINNLSGIYDGTINYPFKSISDAIQYAKEYDTVFLFNGIYHERIKINKPITLIGENKESTILDGMYGGTVIYVYANNVEISGLTVRNSGSGFNYDSCGIYVYADKVLIYDTIIYGNFYGIHIDFSFESTSIYGNQIFNNERDGLIITNSRKFTISNNEIFENGKCGCYVDNSVQGVINNNILTFNTITGITFRESSNNDFRYNYLDGNFEYGINMNDSQSNDVFYNTIKNCARGVYLYDSGRNEIENNNFLENSKNHAFFHTVIGRLSINEIVSSGLNTWDENYWDNLDGNRIYAIEGVLSFFSQNIYILNYDRSPASKPYDFSR